MSAAFNNIGVVVIGRNEGERLRRCLASVSGNVAALVYVDSASTDGSVSMARNHGVKVVELDMSLPFSAARARNAGFQALVDQFPQVAFVQFIDGDCELFPGWMSAARDALLCREALAAVAGRLQERFPTRSIYNRLAEFEWNIQGYGDVSSVGGIFMVRRAAFEVVGGFDPTIPAGEEPELCQRLRNVGWAIGRINVDMAWHDLAMRHFGQWYQRQLRGGYGALDVFWRFGLADFRRNVLRASFWCLWPFLVVGAGWAGNTTAGSEAGWGLASMVFSLLPAQLSRIALKTLRQGHPASVAFPYAFYAMLSYWPQMDGQLRYMWDRVNRRTAALQEYKDTSRDLVSRND